jgi:hypothetical protein
MFLRFLTLLAALAAATLPRADGRIISNNTVTNWRDLIDAVNRADEDTLNSSASVSIVLSTDFKSSIMSSYPNRNPPSITFKRLSEVVISVENTHGSSMLSGNQLSLDMDEGNRFFNLTHGGTLRLVGPITLTSGFASSGDVEKPGHGGAGLVMNGTLVATDVTFEANYATGGGAVHIDNLGRAKFTGCLFKINAAINSGGAIAINNKVGKVGSNSDVTMPGGAALEIIRCKFVQNLATGANGGAIDVNGRSINVHSTAFSKNVAQGDGAAIKIYGAATGSITSSNFTENNCNTADSTGGAIDSADGTLVITHTDFVRNKAYIDEKKSGASDTQGDAIHAEHGEKITFSDCPQLANVLQPTEAKPAVAMKNCRAQACCSQLTPSSPTNPTNPKHKLSASKVWMPAALASGCVLVLMLVFFLSWGKGASRDNKLDVERGNASAHGYSASISEDDRVSNPWQIDHAKLVLRKRIGGGTYGTVFQGMYGKDQVAIKRLTLSPDPDDEEDEGQTIKSVMSEAQLLWDLRHPR